MRISRTACRTLYLCRSRSVDVAPGNNPLCPHGTRHAIRTKTLSQSVTGATQMRAYIARGRNMLCRLLLRILRRGRWLPVSLATDNRRHRQHGHTTSGQESLPCFHRCHLRLALRLRRNYRLASSHYYFRGCGYRRTLRRDNHSESERKNSALCHTHNRSCPDCWLLLVPSIVNTPANKKNPATLIKTLC